ncbi:MAG TPA: DUF4382 domain-containing protein [Nitrososphaerales archaeon]|nr:DUF4382 domain-containing protein [Nitrososphaerales archaeon]
MSSRKQVLTAGIVGLLVAVSAITGMILFLPSNVNLPSNSSLANSTIQPNGSQSQVTSESQTASQSGVEGNQGQLDVLLTDPPTVPSGVTGVYVTYSNVAVHASDAGNQTGWTNSNTSGTLDLMNLVNVSTTIAAVKVTTGYYNALRFNITSAEVAYNGKNYTAFVPRAEITVIIPGGIQVNATNSSAAIIDMQPTVLNIGSGSNPEFIINVATSCMDVPPSAIVKGMDQWGFSFHMTGLQWWTHFQEQYTSNIRITSTTLSSGSLSVTIQNVGSQDVNLSVISVAPLGNECNPTIVSSTTTTQGNNGNYVPRWLPQCFTGSAFFVVLANGTLRPEMNLLLGGFAPGLMHGSKPVNILANLGYTLKAGQTATLTFTGPIAFGFAFRGMTPPGVISGDQYQITVVGLRALAQYIVVAS